MNATLRQSGTGPLHDWTSWNKSREHARSQPGSYKRATASAENLSEVVLLTIGVVGYAVGSLGLTVLAAAIAIIVLPWLLILPAAIAGIAITFVGYVLHGLGLA